MAKPLAEQIHPGAVNIHQRDSPRRGPADEPASATDVRGRNPPRNAAASTGPCDPLTAPGVEVVQSAATAKADSLRQRRRRARASPAPASPSGPEATRGRSTTRERP